MLLLTHLPYTDMSLDDRKPSPIWDAFDIDLFVRASQITFFNPLFSMWVPLLTLSQVSLLLRLERMYELIYCTNSDIPPLQLLSIYPASTSPSLSSSRSSPGVPEYGPTDHGVLRVSLPDYSLVLH